MPTPATPALNYRFSYSATLAPPEIIGPTWDGIRVNFYVTGGRVHGPSLTGTVLPVGGDWLTLRIDGMAMLDVRATFRADDDALIYMTYAGLGDLGVDGYERFQRGELPATLSLRTTPVIRAAPPQHAPLQRLYLLGVGEVNFQRSEVRYDVFSVD